MQKRKIFMGIVLSSILALILFSTGCSKDKTDPANQFSYDKNTYSLSQGIISTNFIGDSMAITIVELFSDGFTIVLDKEEIDSVTGKGEVMYFFLMNDENVEATDGTYSYSTDWKGMTWKNGGFYIQYNTEDDKNTGYDLKGGTVTVKNSGDKNFEFTFNFTTKEGKNVNGFFKGQLKPFKTKM